MAEILKPKAQAESGVVKDGAYQAELSGIRPFANAYGTRIGFEFAIKGGPFDGLSVRRSTAPQLTPQSKLAEVLVGLLGRELTQTELMGGIDLEALIGSTCQILVLQSKSKAGVIYSNVERVFRAS